jgi:hypothetical protein
MWFKMVLILLAMVVVDIVWTIYISSVAMKKPMLAGVASSISLVINSFVVVSFVDDYWYIVPAGIGTFIGTSVAGEYVRRRQA